MKPKQRDAIILTQANIFLMVAWFLPWEKWLGFSWGMSVRLGFTAAYGIWFFGGLTRGLYRQEGGLDAQ